MIDASELRIGNLVLVDGGNVMPFHHEIMAKDILDIESGASKEKGISIEGIRLTPAILERYDFSEGLSNFIGHFYKDLPTKNTLLIDMETFELKIYAKGAGLVTLATDVRYQHHVQNIWRDLTGTELTFNQQ